MVLLLTKAVLQGDHSATSCRSGEVIRDKLKSTGRWAVTGLSKGNPANVGTKGRLENRSED